MLACSMTVKFLYVVLKKFTRLPFKYFLIKLIFMYHYILFFFSFFPAPTSSTGKNDWFEVLMGVVYGGGF